MTDPMDKSIHLGTCRPREWWEDIKLCLRCQGRQRIKRRRRRPKRYVDCPACEGTGIHKPHSTHNLTTCINVLEVDSHMLSLFFNGSDK